MDFPEFKDLLKAANASNTLVSAKHDPNQLTTIYQPYRSVLSHDLTSKLASFIESEKYSVTEYNNTEYPMSPLYFTIEPNLESGFSIPASGVTGTIATSQLDRLVVVSGGTSGIHMYGESSTNISNKESQGKLTHKRVIK